MQQFLCGGRRFYPMSTWVPQGAVGSSQSTEQVSLLIGPEPKWTNDRRCASVGWPTAPDWLGRVKGILCPPHRESFNYVFIMFFPFFFIKQYRMKLLVVG